MKAVHILVTMALLGGCATTNPASAWRPMVDTQRGFSATAYERDLGECRAYAEQNPEADPAAAAQAGARGMATTGGAIGVGTVVAAGLLTGGVALIPMAAAGAFTALTGGMVGAMGGNQMAEIKYKNIVSNCMVGRGYRVIG